VTRIIKKIIKFAPKSRLLSLQESKK